jgi:hypothetical protein
MAKGKGIAPLASKPLSDEEIKAKAAEIAQKEIDVVNALNKAHVEWLESHGLTMEFAIIINGKPASILDVDGKAAGIQWRVVQKPKV